MVRQIFILFLGLVLCLSVTDGPDARDMTDSTEKHSPYGEFPVPESVFLMSEKIAGDYIDRDTAGNHRVPELLSQYGAGKAMDETFYELFDETLHGLWDRYTDEPERTPDIHRTSVTGPVTLAFAGDVNMADDWENMVAYRSRPGGVEGAISASLLKRMRGADVLLVNNEFCFSDRGVPTAGKQYTFRAATENVQLYDELGVDIVSLANNHVFDYGVQAFYDTLNTLSEAEIPYIGAGRNISEAMRVKYFRANGMKIAFIAAAQTEIFRFTKPATAENPGVLPCFAGGGLQEAVATARERADWVVVYLHWGTEYATAPETQQVNLAHELVDNGADIVVGAHPHVLQGIEFYKGKPIAYSLGNFWFNIGRVDTALLEIELLEPGQYRLRVQPCATNLGTVRLMKKDSERRALFKHLEKISGGIIIEDDGTVNPRRLTDIRNPA